MMNPSNDYDATNPLSIESYSKQLIGKTFRNVWEADIQANVAGNKSQNITDNKDTDKKNKGKLGQLIEEKFFHYPCNNDSRPDFPDAGVELKVTPYKINKNGKISAKERLILTMIDYFNVVNEDFEHSHLWKKSKLILLIYYLYKKEIKENLDYEIGYTSLFTPPLQDLAIIKHDYQIIKDKIKAGKAHELSEGDTMYLGAASKASSSADRKKQPFSSELAKPRAFSFKSSYMTYILNNYIVPGKRTYEPIIKNQVVESFEDYVSQKISGYKNYSVDDLCKKFKIDTTKSKKNLEAIIAYRILGINGNKAEEFVKANIVVKTIRIEKNNKIKEHMSFPSFKFKELVKENWDTSTFGNYLRETRFFFIVFKYDHDNNLLLKGCQFWNIPYNDLENEVRLVWEKTKKIINNGLIITTDSHGKNHTNLPKQSENSVCHVRPHAKNKYDTYELPDGRNFAKQCFWLNNKYIFSQLKNEFKTD